MAFPLTIVNRPAGSAGARTAGQMPALPGAIGAPLSRRGKAVNRVGLLKMATFRDKGRNDSGAQ